MWCCMLRILILEEELTKVYHIKQLTFCIVAKWITLWFVILYEIGQLEVNRKAAINIWQWIIAH